MFVINARGSLHMRRGLLSVLILTLGMTPAAAQKTQEFRQGCIASLPLVLDNATLYRQVQMSMNQSVTGWNYSTNLTSNGTHTNCALVSYNALAGDYYNFPMEITKSICVVDEVVVETVAIKMCMLYVNYTSRSQFGANEMRCSTRIQFGVPWFFPISNYYVEDRILAYLRQNFIAWYEIVCSAAPATISFESSPATRLPAASPASYGVSPEALLNVLFA
jgi:hypothetical protein